MSNGIPLPNSFPMSEETTMIVTVLLVIGALSFTIFKLRRIFSFRRQQKLITQ